MVIFFCASSSEDAKNKVEVGNFGVVSVCCKYLLISVLYFLRVVCLKNKLHLPFLRVIFRHFSRLAVRSMKCRSSFRFFKQGGVYYQGRRTRYFSFFRLRLGKNKSSYFFRIFGNGYLTANRYGYISWKLYGCTFS